MGWLGCWAGGGSVRAREQDSPGVFGVIARVWMVVGGIARGEGLARDAVGVAASQVYGR